LVFPAKVGVVHEQKFPLKVHVKPEAGSGVADNEVNAGGRLAETNTLFADPARTFAAVTTNATLVWVGITDATPA
jgi:hypothetical protein